MNIDNQTKLYHIGFSREDVEYATLAILTDDSDYTKDLALALDSKARLICINREYHSYIIHVNETPVLIVSTGFGGPAMGIGLEELSMLGLKSFIRLGETGAVREYLQVGDFVIAKGHYAKKEPLNIMLRLIILLVLTLVLLNLQNKQ